MPNPTVAQDENQEKNKKIMKIFAQLAEWFQKESTPFSQGGYIASSVGYGFLAVAGIALSLLTGNFGFLTLTAMGLTGTLHSAVSASAPTQALNELPSEQESQKATTEPTGPQASSSQANVAQPPRPDTNGNSMASSTLPASVSPQAATAQPSTTDDQDLVSRLSTLLTNPQILSQVVTSCMPQLTQAISEKNPLLGGLFNALASSNTNNASQDLGSNDQTNSSSLNII